MVFPTYEKRNFKWFMCIKRINMLVDFSILQKEEKIHTSTYSHQLWHLDEFWWYLPGNGQYTARFLFNFIYTNKTNNKTKYEQQSLTREALNILSLFLQTELNANFYSTFRIFTRKFGFKSKDNIFVVFFSQIKIEKKRNSKALNNFWRFFNTNISFFLICDGIQAKIIQPSVCFNDIFFLV